MSKDERTLQILEYSSELKDKFSNQASHIQADDITTMLTFFQNQSPVTKQVKTSVCLLK